MGRCRSGDRALATQRDLHVLAVDEHGRMNWQKASGYALPGGFVEAGETRRRL